MVNNYSSICSSTAYFVYGGIFVHLFSILFFIYDPIVVSINHFILISFGSICANSAIASMIIGYRRSSKYFGAISCLIYSQIIWAVLIGIVFFNEYLNIFALIGAFFIVISGILSIPGQYKQVRDSSNF